MSEPEPKLPRDLRVLIANYFYAARADVVCGGGDGDEYAQDVAKAHDALASRILELTGRTPPDEATSRAQFEAHIRATWKVPGSYLGWALKRDDRGDYQDGRAADQWSGWQAARTQGDAA